MLTTTAAAAADLRERVGTVASSRQLARAGISEEQRRAQLTAGRWQRAGKATVLHNGPLTRSDRIAVTVINCGPRAIVTSFTAAQLWGLRGWERDEIHVLAPAGTRRPNIPLLQLHRIGDWSQREQAPGRRIQRIAAALVLAASSFRSPRPGCGILAAAVQQRLTTAGELRSALIAACRTRHRKELLLATADIAQGAQALSEIDLGRLCRRFGLPQPVRQAVRIEPDGRRRYLDAEWRLPDGRAVAAEIDGAHHLSPERWVDDQMRQNSIVLDGTLVLRFPSIVVRDRPELVAKQLRRALLGR